MKKKGRNGYWKQEVKKEKVNYVSKIIVILTLINGIFTLISFLAVRQMENVNINGVFSMLENSNIGKIAIKNESNKYLSSLDYNVYFFIRMSVYDDNDNIIYEQPIPLYSDPTNIDDSGNTLGDIVNLTYEFSFSTDEYYSNIFINEGKNYRVSIHPDNISSVINLKYKKVTILPNFLNVFPDTKYIILKKGRKFSNISDDEFLSLRKLVYIDGSIFNEYPDSWWKTLNKVTNKLEKTDVNTLKSLYKENEDILDKCFNEYNTDY